MTQSSSRDRIHRSECPSHTAHTCFFPSAPALLWSSFAIDHVFHRRHGDCDDTMAALSGMDAAHPEEGRVRVSQQADVFSFGVLVAVLYGAYAGGIPARLLYAIHVHTR